MFLEVSSFLWPPDLAPQGLSSGDVVHAVRSGAADAVFRRNLAKSSAELGEIADGRVLVLAEAAGITAGSWYAWPSTHSGYELVAAGEC